MGYVLFEKEDDAQRAVKEANDTFFGPNLITVVLYKTIQQRIKEGTDVRVLSLPKDWKPEDVETYISQQVGMEKDKIFKADPYVAADKRPGEVNSNGSMAIFTCIDVETSHKVIEEFKNKEEKFENVNDNAQICQKLTRGMMGYMKATEQKESPQKNFQSDRNV